MIIIIANTQQPSKQERTQKQRGYTTENERKSRPESSGKLIIEQGRLRVHVYQREKRRNDKRSSKITEQRERNQVLYGATQFAGDDRRCGGRGHDKTQEQALRKKFVIRECDDKRVGAEAEDNLYREDNPMPPVQTEVQRGLPCRT